MKNTRLLAGIAATIALLVLLLTSCTGRTSIKTLLDDPGRFDNQTVRISGTVTRSMGVLTFAAYEVDDGTGKLTVVTKEGGSPRQGAKVGVEGVFHSAFTLGPQTIAALVEKQRRTQ